MWFIIIRESRKSWVFSSWQTLTTWKTCDARGWKRMGRIKHEKDRGLDFPGFVLMREQKQISALQNKLGPPPELSVTQCSLLLKLKKTPRSMELSAWHTPLSQIWKLSRCILPLNTLNLRRSRDLWAQGTHYPRGQVIASHRSPCWAESGVGGAVRSQLWS